MNIFCGPIAAELRGFLQFKRVAGELLFRP